MKNNHFVLSIAGLDPSGGAGVFSDLKVFSHLGLFGMGVSTCTTYQTEDSFLGVSWNSEKVIENQLVPLLKQYSFSYVKIGLVKDKFMLQFILDILFKYQSQIKIVWDPIFNPTANYELHTKEDFISLFSSLEKIYLVTPNQKEFAQWGFENIEGMIKKFPHLNYVIKSTQINQTEVIDETFFSGKNKKYSSTVLPFEKHGSGCFFSSCMTAFLVKGDLLLSAYQKTKKVFPKFLTSGLGQLSFHENIFTGIDSR